MEPVNLTSSTILVTGGTGSFGKQLVRTLVEQRAHKIIVFSRDEVKHHEMRQELANPTSVQFIMGDIRNADRFTEACHGVDLIVHAAALKQVPAGELNPTEFIETNVDGAISVIKGARQAGVKRVIALSSDKAANPINVYGATKFLSDKLFVAANTQGYATRYSVVRYGNVIGSRGSVIPFWNQLRKTGTLPLTDPRMTRFWLSLQQGVDFVLNRLQDMQGGEIFVPKIPSMKLTDLAKAMAPECKINVVGIRAGEKLHEVLISVEDARRSVEFANYYIIQPEYTGWTKLDAVPCQEGFSYTSENNDWQLSPSELKALISAS